jgi:hypothetical protein
MLDIATIVLALQLSAPNLNAKVNHHYAKTIYHQQIKYGIDPLDIIAIAAHESHWNQSLISPDNEDWGLMQIRARYVKMPAHYLLDGNTNIKVGSAFMASAKNFCQKWLKREPRKTEWISTYQGSRRFCKETNLAYKVESYSRCLYDSLRNQTSYPCWEIYKNYTYDGIYPVNK